jgi:hypothetical protein
MTPESLDTTCLLLPIHADDHVHVRNPRRTHRLNMATMSAPIAAGYPRSFGIRRGVQNGVYGTLGLFLNGVRHDGAWDRDALFRALNPVNHSFRTLRPSPTECSRQSTWLNPASA